MSDGWNQQPYVQQKLERLFPNTRGGGRGSRTSGDSQLICYFFQVKPSDFGFVTWFMSILKFGLPQLSFEVFRAKTKTELFWAISVSSKRNIKINDFELVLSRQTSQRNYMLNYASGNGLDIK